MAITRAQAPVHNGSAASGTTLSVTLNGIAAASLIAISGSHDTNSSSTVSVADDLAAAALPINNTTAGGFSQKTALFYYKNYGGGNRTFTMTNSVGAINRGVVVVELAGADTTAPLDGTASGSGTSATPSSGNLSPAPSVDGEYVFGRCEAANQPSFASPASEVFQDTTTFGDTEDYIQPTAAALALTWTQTSALYQALAASFKPAGAAGGGWVGSGSRRVPGARGPFDRRGFLAKRKFDYTPSAVVTLGATILQRKTLGTTGNHTGGRQRRSE